VDDDTVKEPDDGQVLVYDAGDSKWKAQTPPQGKTGPTGPTGPIGGEDKQILFNDGSGASGSPNLTFDYDTNTVSITGGVHFYNGFTASNYCYFNNNTVDSACLLGYTETLEPITLDATDSGCTLDASISNVWKVTNTYTSNISINFEPPSEENTYQATSITLLLIDGATGGTVNWPSEVKWSGGTLPNVSESGTDIFNFTTIDGGTAWYGFVGGLGFS
jgi:hypothetical protein